MCVHVYKVSVLGIEKGIMIGKRFESYYDGIMVMTACRDSQETIIPAVIQANKGVMVATALL